MRSNILRLTGVALVAGLIGLALTAPVAAQSNQSGGAWTYPDVSDLIFGAARDAARTGPAARPTGDGPDALLTLWAYSDENGVPLAPPTTPTVLTGYVDAPRGAVITWTGNGAIDASADAITLEANGVYRIVIRGQLIIDETDGSVSPQANAEFAGLLNGVPSFSCMTQKARYAYERVTASNYTKSVSCETSVTIQVKNQGAGQAAPPPFVFPKGTTVQLAMLPRSGAYGDLTLMAVEMEVVRVGK